MITGSISATGSILFFGARRTSNAALRAEVFAASVVGNEKDLVRKQSELRAWKEIISTL
jgi:hypothetical protein